MFLLSHHNMSLLHLSAVLALAASTIAAPLTFDCGNTNYFVDGSLEKTFNVGPGASCVYAFSWRDFAGSFISAHVDGLDSDYHTTVQMYNEIDGGNNIQFGNWSSGPGIFDTNTYWAPGTVKLAIATGQNSSIAVRISVTVSTATKDATVQTAQVITGSQPITVTDNLVFGTTYVYTSTSKIVFSVATTGFDFVGNGSYLDSVFAYDGQGPTAKLLGSLRQLYSNNVLSGTSLTLFPLSQAKQEGTVIINNQQNMAAFASESMLYFFSHSIYSNTSGVLLDSRSGPGTTSIVSFGTVGNQADYPIITGIKFKNGATVVQVYSGLPTNKMAGTYLKQFTPTDNMSPQAFPGTAITFTVNQGFAVISYTSALTPNARDTQ